MCMVDNCDEPVTMLSRAIHKARKPHQCAECARAIEPGETYHADRYIWECKLHNHKVCQHCQVVRRWLQDECGGWVYGFIEDDIREHATEGCYPMAIHRLAIGMRWKWRAPSGRLLPVPGVPATTLERARGTTGAQP